MILGRAHKEHQGGGGNAWRRQNRAKRPGASNRENHGPRWLPPWSRRCFGAGPGGDCICLNVVKANLTTWEALALRRNVPGVGGL